MLNFESFDSQDDVVQEEPIPEPVITVVETDDRYGKFVVEPLPQGYGMTLGNPLRRVLYGSLPGTAVTWVKIEEVLHEYATIPHVMEEVSDILLNIKDIRIRSEVDRPGKLRLEVAGQGEVSAGDIMASSDFEIVNPELHLVTLDSEESKLSIEFNIERGTGYSTASRGDGLPIGVLPVDAVYTPMKKVNFVIEPVRVGERTNFERLLLEIWTDGAITPVDALRQAGTILVNQFFLFSNTQKELESGELSLAALKIPPEFYNIQVEKLDLSSRILNCLKRASIDSVGQALEMEKAQLLKIRNFGEKSLGEFYERLREMDLLPAELDPDLLQEDSDGGEASDDGEDK